VRSHISPRATKSNLDERCKESDHEDNGDGDDETDSYMETSFAVVSSSPAKTTTYVQK